MLPDSIADCLRTLTYPSQMPVTTGEAEADPYGRVRVRRLGDRVEVEIPSELEEQLALDLGLGESEPGQVRFQFVRELEGEDGSKRVLLSMPRSSLVALV